MPAKAHPYDIVPLMSQPIPQAHPGRLAALAVLFGRDPAPIDRCRVLEIGCGDGGNLVSLAQGMPQASLVGLDLSERHIAMARTMAEAVGTDNIVWFEGDIKDFDQPDESFDYIICRDVFTRVDRETQTAILAKSAALLGPEGILFLGCDALPGGAAAAALGRLLKLHTDHLEAPHEAVQEALAAMDFLVRFGTAGDPGLAAQIETEVNRLRDRLAVVGSGANLYHDHLAGTLEPIYFQDLADRATEAGLDYLAEADLKNMFLHGLPPEATAALAPIAADPIRLTQYAEFIRGRRYMNLLLCRKSSSIMRRIDPVRAAGLLFSESAGAAPEMDDPAARAALQVLAQAGPRALPLKEIGRGLVEDENHPKLTAAQTAELMTELWKQDLVEAWTGQPGFATHGGDRPEVSPLARWQATQGFRWLTSRLHKPVLLPPPLPQLAPLMDGTRDMAELGRQLKSLLEAAKVSKLGKECQEPVELKDMKPADFESMASAMVGHLAGSGLLIG